MDGAGAGLGLGLGLELGLGFVCRLGGGPGLGARALGRGWDRAGGHGMEALGGGLECVGFV